MYSLTYLTRRCTRECGYCTLRDSQKIENELRPEYWLSVFHSLYKMGIKFNLILGNETWLLGENLETVFRYNKVPYALYTSCTESLFKKYAKMFFEGSIDNFSCGIDFPKDCAESGEIVNKSRSAWKHFSWVRKYYPHVDCQGTITIGKHNIKYLVQIVKELSDMGVFIGINTMHWNKDGKFDFFPSKDKLKEFLFTENDIPLIQKAFDELRNTSTLIQNIEYLDINPKDFLTNNWHCEGDPYGGPTIDADGSLRCCGYRKGRYTPLLKIWDLPKHIEEWKQLIELDTKECPGCMWSHPMMYKHYSNDPLKDKILIQHAGYHIEEEKWSKRKVQRI